MGDETLHVHHVSVSNFERLVVLDLDLDPETDPLVQVVSRKNGQGKSSLLNAIAAALGGADWVPKKPVHGDAEKGEVSVNVGPYTIRRSFTKGGGGTIAIKRNEDGSVLSRPAETLADWRSDLTLDPFAFVQMDAKAQRKALLAVLGLEEKLAELDAQREQAYSARTEANRDVKRLTANAEEYADMPAEEPEVVDVTALIEQRKWLEKQQRQYLVAEDEARVAGLAVPEAEEAVACLERELEDARAQLSADRAEKERAEKVLSETRGVPDKAFAEIDSAIEASAESAALRSRWQSAQRVRSELTEASGKSSALTQQIEDVDAEKDRLLRESSLPLPELGVDENGVTFGGVPFEQASDAEKLRAGFAVAMARNPKTRVALIRNGSQLDADNVDLFRELGREFDCQVLIESLSREGQTGVVIEIEDGKLAAKSEVAG